MYKVFYGDKVIVFTNEPDDPTLFGKGLQYISGASLDVAKVLQNLENINSLYIKADDTAEAYEKFASQFRQVDAAGGVVFNNDELVMIFRHGRWDLPKGHREHEESNEQCALREVEEECSLTGLAITGHLVNTRHFYNADGSWVLKTTHWYSMRTHDRSGSPQHEEGITEIRWMTKEEAIEKSQQSYASIREVISSAVSSLIQSSKN